MDYELDATTPDEARKRALRATVVGGLLAGGLDITYACIVWGLRGSSPMRVLQGVASGWLGADAFEGGLGAAALGAISHFGIALAAAAAYSYASLGLTVLRRQAVLGGVVFGTAFYLFMSYVVVPLSAAPAANGVSLTLGGLFAHTVLFGLPIALIARRAARARSMHELISWRLRDE